MTKSNKERQNLGPSLDLMLPDLGRNRKRWKLLRKFQVPKIDHFAT